MSRIVPELRWSDKERSKSKCGGVLLPESGRDI